MKIQRFLPLLACLLLAALLLPARSTACAASNTPAVVEADDSGDSGGSAGMFEATAALGKAFVSGVWSLFGIYIPGFSFTFTFGQLWLGVALASISILVVRLIFGFGGGAPRGVGTRTGSTNRPKISRERRNDEF